MRLTIAQTSALLPAIYHARRFYVDDDFAVPASTHQVSDGIFITLSDRLKYVECRRRQHGTFAPQVKNVDHDH